MSAKIDTLIEGLIGREGRYSNNPNDTGGETMWGITVKVARANGYTGAMREMPRAKAGEIYVREYFVKPGFDRVLLQSPNIAEELLDTAVNMGISTASLMLQRSLNVLNKTHTTTPLYPDLIADGQLGDKSLAALATFLRIRKSEGEVVMLRMLNALQGARYIMLTETREANEEFVYGWFLNRVVI